MRPEEGRMPTYHVHMSSIKKGGHQGGAAGFARYLSRDGLDEASQLRRYLEREGLHQGKDDLVAAGHANRLCRKFCVGGREGAVAPVGGEIKRPGSRTVRPQCGPRLRPPPSAVVS